MDWAKSSSRQKIRGNLFALSSLGVTYLDPTYLSLACLNTTIPWQNCWPWFWISNAYSYTLEYLTRKKWLASSIALYYIIMEIVSSGPRHQPNWSNKMHTWLSLPTCFLVYFMIIPILTVTRTLRIEIKIMCATHHSSTLLSNRASKKLTTHPQKFLW